MGRGSTLIHSHASQQLGKVGPPLSPFLLCSNPQEKEDKAHLQAEVQHLREDNLRLQEESQNASDKLKKFTEWVFNTIDMSQGSCGEERARGVRSLVRSSSSLVMPWKAFAEHPPQHPPLPLPGSAQRNTCRSTIIICFLQKRKKVNKDFKK